MIGYLGAKGCRNTPTRRSTDAKSVAFKVTNAARNHRHYGPRRCCPYTNAQLPAKF